MNPQLQWHSVNQFWQFPQHLRRRPLSAIIVPGSNKDRSISLISTNSFQLIAEKGVTIRRSCILCRFQSTRAALWRFCWQWWPDCPGTLLGARQRQLRIVDKDQGFDPRTCRYRDKRHRTFEWFLDGQCRSRGTVSSLGSESDWIFRKAIRLAELWFVWQDQARLACDPKRIHWRIRRWYGRR